MPHFAPKKTQILIFEKVLAEISGRNFYRSWPFISCASVQILVTLRPLWFFFQKTHLVKFQNEQIGNWRDAFFEKKVKVVVGSPKFVQKRNLWTVMICRNFDQKFLPEPSQKSKFVPFLEQNEAFAGKLP